jgi:hypothetical protein
MSVTRDRVSESMATQEFDGATCASRRMRVSVVGDLWLRPSVPDQ